MCDFATFWGICVNFGIFQVMQRQFLRTGITLGSFKLDVATVMSQQGEKFVFILTIKCPTKVRCLLLLAKVS